MKRLAGRVSWHVMISSLLAAAALAFAGHQRAAHATFMACFAVALLLGTMAPMPQRSARRPARRLGWPVTLAIVILCVGALLYMHFCRTNLEVGLGWLAAATATAGVQRWSTQHDRQQAA